MGFEEVCRSHNDCVTGNCVGGICKKTSPSSKCRDDDKDTCPTGYNCNDKNKCVRKDPSSRPSKCKKNADCGSDEVCFNSICHDKVAGLGMNCGSGVKCDDDLYCFSGYCVKNCDDDNDCEDKFLCKMATSKRKGACLYKPRDTAVTATSAATPKADPPKVAEKSWIIKNAPWLFAGGAVFVVIVALVVILLIKKSNRSSYNTA